MPFKSAFYFLIITPFITLSACQTTGFNGAGKGPISLSPQVTKYFQNNYSEEFRGILFLINSTGTNARYVMCPAAECEVADEVTWINWCTEQMGEPCYVFAYRQQIVWQGPVKWDSYEGVNSPSRSLSNSTTGGNDTSKKLTDQELCSSSINKSTGKWENSTIYKTAIEDAKNAGMSEESCRELLGLSSLKSVIKNKENLKSNKGFESLERYEDKCSELGLRKGTEKYRECVLRLWR